MRLIDCELFADSGAFTENILKAHAEVLPKAKGFKSDDSDQYRKPQISSSALHNKSVHEVALFLDADSMNYL